jgi:putative tricarboxylic transport membrane protein
MLEQQLRRALAISQGDPSIFVTRPISFALLALALALVVIPAVLQIRREMKRRRDDSATSPVLPGSAIK